jgi:Neuraminidase (sialidase)
VELAENANRHYGFPRMVRAKNGDLLLFYRVGTTHAYDRSSIALRRSTDDGASWSQQRIIWRDGSGISAHNPVPLVTDDGRVILWVSRYRYTSNPGVHHGILWAVSDDHGETWSQFTTFDSSRLSYFVTDAIHTSDGLLAASVDFASNGIDQAHVVIRHSEDDGRNWSVISHLSLPNENIGDEVALIEVSPGTILAIMRDRHGGNTYNYWSTDGGHTWSSRTSIGAALDAQLQRPVLTRLDSDTIVLSGRERSNRQMVFYVSRDNGQSFAERYVLDNYSNEGGYSTAVVTGPQSVLFSWYSDEGGLVGLPDIKLATIDIL